MSKPAFVLGNGRSRLVADPSDLQKHGPIYGCNALYRDFAPDFLVATDPGMSKEIEDSGYALNRIFYTRKPTAGRGGRTIPHHYGFSSGPIAVKLAAIAGHQTIYLLGFDLQGIGGLQNNVYSGTPNYRPSGEKATFHGNWVDQLSTIFKEHPSQSFVRLVAEDGTVPFQWLNIKNYGTVPLGEFLPNINSKPWQKLRESPINIR